MADANRDQNHVPIALGQSSTDATVTLPFKIDSATGRLLVDAASGSGTVTDFIFTNANGISGVVATSTTTPTLTLTLGAITPSSVVATGTIRSNTGLIVEETGAGTDTITIQAPASIAASYTLTLPINDGGAGEVLSTDGNGVLSWISAGGVPTTITVANEATDATCFIAFFTAATGDLGPKTNVNMTFNSSTGVVTFASAVLTTADINGGTADNVVIGGSTAAAATFTTLVVNTSALPGANDGAALGASGTAWSDLFLASGAVINFNAGNVTLTHSAGVLTVGGSGATTLALGSNSITITGSIAATGARVTKGWFTDVESTNMPTVGGTAILTSLTAPQFTTIELGAASDTTLSRVSAGVIAVEGVTILTVAGGTLTGSITLGENTGIALDPAGSADGKWSGITITGTSDYTQAFGDLVYLKASNSRWAAADADAVGTAGTVMLAMVVSAGTSGNACTLLLQGQIRADAKFPALTIGAPVYAGEAAGEIQVAIPTGADNVIRVVGFALTADEIYFNPSQDHQTTVA